MPTTDRVFKTLVIITGLFAAVWMVLEGDLRRDGVLAALLLMMGLLAVVRRRSWARPTPGRSALVGAVIGVAFGAGLTLLTLALMALKTGLHAHGPEYTIREIVWVWQQLPLWAGVGGLLGLGFGLLAAARN